MTTRKYSSRSQQTTLTSSITAGVTSMVVGSASSLLGGATVTGTERFTVVIDPDTAVEEIVDVSVVAGDTLTIIRGIDNAGTGQVHSAGAVVRHMAIGRDYREANLHIEATAAYNDGTATHDLHGIASGEGDVVGTGKTQTLTNKTLTSPTITNPTITAGGGAEFTSIIFEGSTADNFETTLTVTDPTQDNTITLPNTTGTVVIVDATQTLTNKTLTSPTISGSPTITGLSSAGMSATSATPKDYVDSILGSATAASTSATSAAASATAAATSATSAANSATSSASSASAAATSATSAATSATSAATSATAAATSATSAAASATAAATSATSAEASATAAANSVATIATSATSAANSATAAATSATSAANSATSSATSASAAATSATSAAASATAAATSASSASTSASSALTSANSAAVSAASAAAAVTTAIQASIIDAKGDLIVGTAADTAGRLAVGTNGYILTADSAETTGIKWSAAPAGYLAPTIGTTVITSGTTVSTIDTVTLNNATLTGTLTAGATSGTNGYLLTATTSGVTWAAAPVSLPSQTGNTGKLLTTDGTTASWAGAAPIASTTEPATLIDGLIWIDTDGSVVGQQVVRWSKAPAGGTTSLSGLDDSSVTLSYTTGYEQVFRNGVLLSRGNDYTATDGTSITLTDATITGDIIEVIGSAVLAIADVYTQAQADANYVGKALVDAKGDIVTASADNTPARLAVGNNGETLVADSSTSTGLRWQSDYAAGKNKIINGDFGIWQRGSSLTPTTGQVYTTDRFLTLRDGTGATVTVSRQTFTPNAAGNPTGAVNGNNYFYRQAQSVAGTGGTYNLMEQRIEGAVLAGQTVTFSFWAKAAASLTLPQIDYEYTIGGTNTSANVTSNIAITTSWQRFSYTFTMPTYSGLTPNNTSDFFGIRLWYPNNTTFTFDTWGWQLEAGSTATAFQTATGTIQGELAACQRYYFRYTAATAAGNYMPFGMGHGIDANNARFMFQFPVALRGNPTLTFTAASTFQKSYGTALTAIATGETARNSVSVDVTKIGEFAANQGVLITAANNQTAYIEVSAEL